MALTFELLKRWMTVMERPIVPDECLKQALELIEKEELGVTRYPGGAPSLTDAYDIAVRIHNGEKN